MHPFDFHRATDTASAITSGGRDGARFIAGGTNLVDLMKAGVEAPAGSASEPWRAGATSPPMHW